MLLKINIKFDWIELNDGGLGDININNIIII